MQYTETRYVMHCTLPSGLRTNHIVRINANVSQLEQLASLADAGEKLHRMTAIRFTRPRD